jgi:hypothetical protein
METLVKEVKENRERFKQKIKKEGLSYQGSDAVECGCGNKFAPEGRYGRFCVENKYNHKHLRSR